MKKLNTILITGLVALATGLQAYTSPKFRQLETRAVDTLQNLDPSSMGRAYESVIHVIWKNDYKSPQEAFDYYVSSDSDHTALQVIEAFNVLRALAVEALGQAKFDKINRWRGEVTIDGDNVILSPGPYIQGGEAGFVNPALMEERKITLAIQGAVTRLTRSYAAAAEALWVHPWERTYSDELGQEITETVYPPTPQEVFDFAVANSPASATDLHTYYQGLKTLVSIWDPENPWLYKAGIMQLNEDGTVTMTLPDPDAN